MMLLGAVLGVGVALTLSRVFVDLAPAYTVAGLVAGAVMGLVVAVWVVAMRRTLRDRAVLERWVSEMAGELRAVVEQHVATRVLDAESALITEQAHRDEAEAALVADRVAAIDDELREHTAAATAASVLRDRELPSLQRALDAVQAELAGIRPKKT
jgi:phosphate/sulfate permease